MLRSAVPDEDLAPPPSEEDIFGQIESIKQQFAEENQQLNRQLEENKVRANTVKYKINNTCLFPDEDGSKLPRETSRQETAEGAA